jgi:hypothetical protein
MENRIKALAQHLGIEESEITVSKYEETLFEVFDGQNSEYRVMTETEADILNDEMIDLYIEDCVLTELPKAYRNYFDTEKFKKDCEYDGRGINLAPYDHEEHEVFIEGEWFFIYRTN